MEGCEIEDVSGELEFRDVEFSYPDREEVLQGLNLLVPAGQTVGLVGSAGSGKTTLMGLLMRFHDVNQGPSPWKLTKIAI